MSRGQWTRIWDGERQRWFDAFIEIPVPSRLGVATPLPGAEKQLLDRTGKPMNKPTKRTIGFRHE